MRKTECQDGCALGYNDVMLVPGNNTREHDRAAIKGDLTELRDSFPGME